MQPMKVDEWHLPKPNEARDRLEAARVLERELTLAPSPFRPRIRATRLVVLAPARQKWDRPRVSRRRDRETPYVSMLKLAGALALLLDAG